MKTEYLRRLIAGGSIKICRIHTSHYMNELKVNISSRHRQSSKVLDCTTTHPRVVHFVISLCPTVNTLHLTSDSKTTSHSSSAVYGSTTLLVHYFQPICLCRRVAKMLHCGVEGAQKLSAKGMRIEPRRVGSLGSVMSSPAGSGVEPWPPTHFGIFEAHRTLKPHALRPNKARFFSVKKSTQSTTWGAWPPGPPSGYVPVFMYAL